MTCFFVLFSLQVPGGWVAEKFSAKHVFGVGALLNALCALLCPIASKASYIVLVALRIVMGIAGVSNRLVWAVSSLLQSL